MPNSTLCLSFDFDAMSVWFGYQNVTPAMLYRGEYGARVGVPRLLKLLDDYRIQATFFVPGHTVDSFPAEVEAILKAGHEVAHHSYAHVDPSEQTSDAERADMERAWKTLERVGVKPLGFRSPSADYSHATLSLIEEFGFLYDSSLMADDFRPYHPRVGDQVTQQSPLVKGTEARVWELPICFEFDDWVHFQFNFNPYRNGTSAPSKVLEIWTADFDWMHQHLDGGILTVAMHPQVIGRAHRVAMLEQFITHCLSRGDVTFARMGDVAKGLAKSNES
jgi:peptidoglycan/xylan/chitin deacetylase (PgdA/CDA1 family)